MIHMYQNLRISERRKKALYIVSWLDTYLITILDSEKNNAPLLPIPNLHIMDQNNSRYLFIINKLFFEKRA